MLEPQIVGVGARARSPSTGHSARDPPEFPRAAWLTASMRSLANLSRYSSTLSAGFSMSPPVDHAGVEGQDEAGLDDGEIFLAQRIGEREDELLVGLVVFFVLDEVIEPAGRDHADLPVIAPGWLDHFIYNEYYKTDEGFIFALADALREEYLAVVLRPASSCRSTTPAWSTGGTC